MTAQLPASGVRVLAKALLTYGRRARELPQDFSKQFTGPALDLRHVAQYRQFIGFTEHEGVPLTYW
jgi:hypothetical protein